MAKIAFGYHRRWSNTTFAERSAMGKRLRRQKGAKHAAYTHAYMGHYMYMYICKRYKALYKRVLTPAERNWIRETYKKEIAATSVGWPWPKKARVSYPDTSEL